MAVVLPFLPLIFISSIGANTDVDYSNYNYKGSLIVHIDNTFELGANNGVSTLLVQSSLHGNFYANTAEDYVYTFDSLSLSIQQFDNTGIPVFSANMNDYYLSSSNFTQFGIFDYTFQVSVVNNYLTIENTLYSNSSQVFNNVYGKSNLPYALFNQNYVFRLTTNASDFSTNSTYQQQIYNYLYQVLQTGSVNNAYDKGYSYGYDIGSKEGYSNGYSIGFNEGVSTDSTASTIFSGILSVGLIPINFFLSIFNFNILGINLTSLISGLLSIACVIILIRTIKGGGSSD